MGAESASSGGLTRFLRSVRQLVRLFGLSRPQGGAILVDGAPEGSFRQLAVALLGILGLRRSREYAEMIL